MRLRPHTHAALLSRVHKICKDEITNNAQTTAARQTIKRDLRCLAPAFPQKPQNFSGEVVQPLTSGWILLPAVMKCKRVCKIFFTIFLLLHFLHSSTKENPGAGCLRRGLTAIIPPYETLATG